MLSNDVLWYKDAIIYELHVRCFCDHNGDGIGDFQGLTEKLDYLQDLGITTIWLLPFYPSPLKDDGYDIADYTDVHPTYGTLRDFKVFLREAHRRGLRVITELVINHTSDQHPWFQRARHAKPGSHFRDFYVWNATPDKYKETRIIFQDFESSNWTWDSVAESYFWHRFYSHQPDLNFENPEVQKAILKILSFWLKLGVDGVRLDAVPYLFEREGTICENLPETHAFLKKLRTYVDGHFSNRMFLAEANQWPEDAASYFGEGDECHMAFHFPIMPRLFMSIHLEDSLPLIEINNQTPTIPENCQWALFLRNHDELTLEMVTDEERDYMFRVYAHDPQARINLGIRRRLAPLLKNDRRKIELMNSLLFSLVGTPVLYYGDEIGMGDNIYLGDRNGVRTPMQWSNDRNAGFSKTNPQRLYLPPIIDPEYHYETVNVEAQSNNPFSLLWWTKQLITLRKRFKAFGRGDLHFITPANRKVLVFLRSYKQERLLIIANLSRFPQYVELDLASFNGYNVIELFSGERFPKIGELPYFLTLGPYGYYWFALEKEPQESPEERLERERERLVETVVVHKDGDSIFNLESRRNLETILRNYLKKRTWFKLLPHMIDRTKTKIVDHWTFPSDTFGKIHSILYQVVQTDGIVERYPLFLVPIKNTAAEELLEKNPECVVAQFKVQTTPDETHILFDLDERVEVRALFGAFLEEKKRLRTERGELHGIVLKGEHPFLSENRQLIFLAKLEEGLDVDVEMRLYLSEKKSFHNYLPLVGYLEYVGDDTVPASIAKEVVSAPTEHNALELTIEEAEHFLDRMEAERGLLKKEKVYLKESWISLAHGHLDPSLHNMLESALEVARHLGETTANFHLAMGASSKNRDFDPLPFTLFYQRSLYQTLRRKVLESFTLIRMHEDILPSSISEEALLLLSYEKKLLSWLQVLPHYKFKALRLRYHGHYRLENLIYSGQHFLICHFEGNPYYSYTEKRYKRSPLVDVSSMLFSYAEAGFTAVERQRKRGLMTDQELKTLYEWTRLWFIWMGSSFLRAYLRTLGTNDLLPANPKEIDFLLGVFLLEQCMERIAEEGRVGGIKIEVPVLMLSHWLPIYEKIKP